MSTAGQTVRLHAVVVTTKHPPVKHPVMLLMQATMFLAQPKRARLLVLLEPLALRPAQSRVLTLLQATTCHLLVKRVRLHAVLVTTTSSGQTSCDAADAGYYVPSSQPKRARLLVLLERLVVRQVRACVLTLLQDTTCHQRSIECDCMQLQVTIKHHPVKHPVMLLMQATMFHGTAQTSQTACALGTYNPNTGSGRSVE